MDLFLVVTWNISHGCIVDIFILPMNLCECSRLHTNESKKKNPIIYKNLIYFWWLHGTSHIAASFDIFIHLLGNVRLNL